MGLVIHDSAGGRSRGGITKDGHGKLKKEHPENVGGRLGKKTIR